MRLKKITLENFRCFERLELELHPQMTVLVAENGQGKSTILDAIRIALWPFVSSFDLAKNTANDPGNTITIDDIRLERMESRDMARQLPCRISAHGDYGDGEENVWIRYRDKETRNSKVKEAGDSGSMRRWSDNLQKQVRSNQSPPINLPVFGYYGTGRLWAQKKLTERARSSKDKAQKTDFYIRTFAYLNCLDPASSFKHFKDWFIWRSKIQMETLLPYALGIKNINDGPAPTDIKDAVEPIAVVNDAISTLLKGLGWKNLKYSPLHEHSLILHHDTMSTMKVDSLSDGIRSMLAMAGDIAYRCIKLNPHLGLAAAEQTEGVVMIDEVDMHLHPGWQQTVLGQLQAAFPKIQFIVTTHSPQVLSSVDAACIRVLKPVTNEEGRPSITVENINQQTKGVASSDLLAEIMGVDPIPDLPEARNLARYHALIQQNLYSSDDGLNLRASLEQHFGARHPVILECERMIRLQAFKQKLPLPQSGLSDKG